ncbi:hypothetical protein Tco_1071894, partial [Tanacetum coccineum]
MDQSSIKGEDIEDEQVEMCFDLDDEDQDIIDLKFQFDKLDAHDDADDDDDDEDDDYDRKVLAKTTFWFDTHKYKFIHGVEIRPNICRRGESDDLDLCSICLKPWTMDKLHQI